MLAFEAIAFVTVVAKAASSFNAAANAAAIKAATEALATAKSGTDQAAIDAAQAALDKEKAVKPGFEKALNEALKAAGYPLVAADNTSIAKASNFFDIFTGQKLAIVAILTYLIILVTMVYGPIAAALVEMFPARIRYTSMSLPYHIGNGWFGGFLPTTAFAMVAATGNIYYGLWYPVVVAAATAVIGALFIREMKGADIEA